MRRCFMCKEVKPIKLFELRKNRPLGRGTRCKSCGTKRVMEYHARNRERTAATQRRYFAKNSAQIQWREKALHYGLTELELHTIFQRQDGLCAICECPLDLGRRTHVDHDHDTGVVRALLCISCNAAIGYLKDDPLLVDAAACYLVEHNAQAGRAARKAA